MTIRILVVDTGESALRIARSIVEMGYIPVGLYTYNNSCNRRKLFKYDVKIPDLNDYNGILKIAEDYGVDAIYPGPSFLSEDISFARIVVERGFTLINTPVNLLEKMRNRVFIKKLFKEYDLPVCNWSVVKDVDEVLNFTREHGFAVIVRSIYGGLTSVLIDEKSVRDFFDKIKTETVDKIPKEFIVEAVGNGFKYIEIQLISDGSNVIHLYDRDISILFNNRVIVCEAPSHIVNNEVRKRYLNQAVDFVKNTGFIGVCSIGLVYSIRDGSYYFVDFTPRLKREHYVSEMITGIDIVKKQLSIVFEKKLDIKQDNVSPSGCSIGVFIDTYNPFKKKYSSGIIRYYSEPHGMGIRIESIIDNNVEINPEFRDFLSSVTVCGFNRYEAIHRLENALNQYVIHGIDTNIPFIKSIISHPVFRKGYYTIDFIDRNWFDLMNEIKNMERLHAILLLSVLETSGRRIDMKSIKNRIISTERYDSRISSIKRKAWFYWIRLRRRVSRK
uniref:ATP-grasp domain-containing protein n=1 Tax=Staphylothermus marinus TaxID=2280 RepID=A0A7C4HDQ7_STAMA